MGVKVPHALIHHVLTSNVLRQHLSQRFTERMIRGGNSAALKKKMTDIRIERESGVQTTDLHHDAERARALLLGRGSHGNGGVAASGRIGQEGCLIVGA